MCATIMQSLTFMIFIVSKQIATLKFLPHIDAWPAGLTLITKTHIFHVSQKLTLKSFIWFIYFNFYNWNVWLGTGRYLLFLHCTRITCFQGEKRGSNLQYRFRKTGISQARTLVAKASTLYLPGRDGKERKWCVGVCVRACTQVHCVQV